MMSLYFKAQSLVSDDSANQQSPSILRKNVQAIANSSSEPRLLREVGVLISTIHLTENTSSNFRVTGSINKLKIVFCRITISPVASIPGVNGLS